MTGTLPRLDRSPLGSIAGVTEPANTDDLRIGNAEREQAVQLLHDAVGAGYLDLQEFDERSRVVYAARTRGELRSVLADLPTAATLFPPAAPVGVTAQTVYLKIGWETVTRRGTWELPAHLVIEGNAGTADLDLRSATIPVGGSVIDVAAAWSTVKFTLDDRIVVRAQLELGTWSSYKDKAGEPSGPGGPTITLRGNPSATSVVVRRR